MANKFSKASLGLGGGLLNEKSKELATNDFKITYISIDDILENEKNDGFSMDEIEDLKTSIEEVGLEQNLVVKDLGNGKYKLLSGHRRFRALKELVADGNDKFKNAPCVIKNLSKIELPLDEEMKELYAIATTNAEVRKNTPGDLKKLMEMLSSVYDKLKENGYKKLGKRRDFLADKLGVSSRTVGMLSYIDKNLNHEYKEDFESGNLPLRTANELAHLPADEQKKFVDKQDGEFKADDVTVYREKVETKAEKKAKKVDNKTYQLNKSDFEYLEVNANSVYSRISDTVINVDSAEYEKIKKIEKTIKKQFDNLEHLLDKARENYKPVDNEDEDLDIDKINQYL